MKEINHPALIQEFKFNLDTAGYLNKLDKKERLPPKKKEIDRHNSQSFFPKNII